MDFEEIWRAYPRKIGKAAALKKYQQALKRTSHENIIRGITEYAEHKRGTDPKFICHLATWLHQDRWSDNLAQERNNIPQPCKTSTQLSAAYKVMQKKRNEVEPDTGEIHLPF